MAQLSSEDNRRLDPATELLMNLARALHAYGMPSDRVEEALGQVTEGLGLEAQYLVTPTSIIASIGPPSDPRTLLLRLSPGEVDLAKLAELYALVARVTEGRIELSDAAREVARLAERRSGYPAWLTILCFALVSASAAAFFDGGWPEVATSAVVGLGIGLLARIAARAQRLLPVLPAAAGLLAVTAVSQIGAAGGAIFDGFVLTPFIPVLAGLIVLVPGLTLTIAVNELATGHLVSGTARFVGSLVTFLQLGFGIALGGKLAAWLLGSAPTALAAGGQRPEALPSWIVGAALAVMASGLTVLFKARPRHWPLILAASTISFLGARLGSLALGPELGALLGAWLVAWLGYLSGRLWALPSAVAILPGILLLVPGSLGFRSLSSLLANDVVSGLEAGFTMVLVAFSLVTGLLLASLTVRSKQAF